MSIQTEMMEIRDFDSLMLTAGVPVGSRIAALNDKFDDWVFTAQARTGKIDANRIDDLYGKSIEV